MLRVSGPQAAAVAAALTGGPLPAPRVAALRRLSDPRSGEPIDQALLLWFPAPRSETGEDLLEIQHHGGAAVQGMLLTALEGIAGCRPAGPGEFTRQAFLNGKLDLTAAEGLADLVDATTRAQARQALRQLEGGLGRLYAGWRERLLNALARIEAEIDFAADEEVPQAMLAPLLPDLVRLRAEFVEHLADDGRGERLRAGVTVAVIGAPNVGKSSLVNLLARRDVAIVTAIRRHHARRDRGPARPGWRAGDASGHGGPARDRGSRRGRGRRARPASRGAGGSAAAGGRARRAARRASRRRHHPGGQQDRHRPWCRAAREAVAISCLTGAGIAELTRTVAERAAGLVSAGEAPLLTRARHRTAVAEAEAALGRLEMLAAGGAELALVAEDLRLAARAIGGITGAVGVEDVLDRIFATFCIGK